jgi:hypothetical protein
MQTDTAILNSEQLADEASFSGTKPHDSAMFGQAHQHLLEPRSNLASE